MECPGGLRVDETTFGHIGGARFKTAGFDTAVKLQRISAITISTTTSTKIAHAIRDRILDFAAPFAGRLSHANTTLGTYFGSLSRSIG